MAEFENYFNITGKTCVLMVAFYDADEPLRYIPTGDAFMNAKKSTMFQSTFDSSKLTVGTPPNMRYPLDTVSFHRDGFYSSDLYVIKNLTQNIIY